jgi:adenine-specific DNA-methyltransferase
VTTVSNPFEPISDERDHHGPGEVQGNLDALARLFPDAVVDGTVDLDVLADLIGQKTDRSGAEGFGLRWPGMNEARRLSAQPATQTLLPRPDESVDWDTTRNIVIEGDNLEVLRLLRRGYTGAIDVIYIDPPYNTGNDFVYDDRFGASRAEIETAAGLRDENGSLQNGAASDLAADRRTGASRHSKWLSMMYPRVLLAHHLLNETGVIIAAIDDIEHARLRLLLDRVFGSENFAANVVWQGGNKNDSRFTSGGLDYMLIYAKNKARLVADDVRWQEPKTGHDHVLRLGSEAWERAGNDSAAATKLFRAELRKIRAELEPAVFRYDQIDEDGRVFQAADPGSPNPRPNLRYDVSHPLSGRPVRMPENGWRFSQEAMEAHIANKRMIFGPDETTMPRYKRYLEEMANQAIVPFVSKERASASYALVRLMGDDIFPFSKDVGVLATWINSVSEGKEDAIILDFFAGSGSTGHAVMDLNAADGGNRRYILVQLDEPVNKDGYATIADIARERLRRAGAQIAQQLKPDAQDIDTGFRSYNLANSNVKPWDGTAELDLLESVDNLVGGRTTDDLLVEMMLRLGIDLVTPVETREVAGSALYSLAGTLYAFFGVDLDVAKADEVARAIVGWREEDPVDSDVTVVVRDTGFRDSGAKLNLAAALRQAGITTLRSI